MLDVKQLSLRKQEELARILDDKPVRMKRLNWAKAKVKPRPSKQAPEGKRETVVRYEDSIAEVKLTRDVPITEAWKAEMAKHIRYVEEVCRIAWRTDKNGKPVEKLWLMPPNYSDPALDHQDRGLR